MFGRNTNREGQKLRSKSNQRRKLKSPIRIKEKIKELQEKLEKDAIFRRQKPYEKEQLVANRDHSPRQEELSPFKRTFRTYQVHSSDRLRGNSLFSTARHPITSKKASQKEDREFITPKPLKLGRIHSQRELPSRDKDIGKDEQILQRLKAQNDKYKQIYNKSQGKMQELQYVLHEIKGKHESQKYILQRTIDNLQKKIDEKKINLGHLYAYDEKGNNFLLVQDRIIAQTDNENSSSSPDAASKRNSNLPKPSPQLSNLSLQSK